MRAVKVARVVGIAIVVLVALPLAAVHLLLAGSLPKIDGSTRVEGLANSVTISRDGLGIPTIEASTREDLAYGTGFVHAQDRFFQMDLSRRLAAGELSELFGRAALEQDRRARLFRFRHIAEQVLAQTPADQRAAIEAYARGVNAGLASLRSRPWEYWLLQSTPAPWKPEDTALVSYAMWWDLQYHSLRMEMQKRALNMRLGGAECAHGWKCALEFFYPRGTSWDSPNTATGAFTLPVIRLPTPEELDLRAPRNQLSRGAGAVEAPAEQNPLAWAQPAPAMHPGAVGSNGWVLGGALVEGGGALVASDMHLNQRVPTTWYRARLRLQPAGGAVASSGAAVGASANGNVSGARPGGLDLNGLTLAGVPVFVAGSNGRIAWGFTNAYGDWSDVTFVPCVAVDGTGLRTSSGSIPLTTVQEVIRIKGEADATFEVRAGPDGVLFEAEPALQRCWFARWIATMPAATNFNIMALETATTTAEAVALAPGIGIPHLNFTVGDSLGHIAWTIIGRIPESTDAELRFSGQAPWTSDQTHPRLIDPPGARAWTANARAIDDAAAEAAIGGDEAALGADYDLGARAKQIHDGLVALKAPAKPSDMLRIQLDDRAVFLARWRDLLVDLLDDEAVRDQPARAELKRLVTSWRARAATDSVGYRLVHSYHSQVERAVWEMFLDALDIHAMQAPSPSQFEGALWELVTRKPPHLLSPAYASWRELLLKQVDATLERLTVSGEESAAPCPRLDQCAWGARRPTSIRHPLSGALPFAAKFLDMPTVELPGDHNMPRVQDGAFGASERFAVSPGRETQGYLHIAGGQSGHPLSPFYRTGFREWAEGRPLPFLPGRPEHELTLRPAR